MAERQKSGFFASSLTPGMHLFLAVVSAWPIAFLTLLFAAQLTGFNRESFAVESYIYNKLARADTARFESKADDNELDGDQAGNWEGDAPETQSTGIQLVFDEIDWICSKKVLSESLAFTEEQCVSEFQRKYKEHGLTGFVERELYGAQDQAGFIYILLALGTLGLVLILQGDGFEVDSGKRRDPMWEWYRSFPISMRTVFAAEALAPLAGNTFLISNIVIYAGICGAQAGSFLVFLVAIPIILPMAIAIAISAKALEVLVMLRCTPKTRGLWIALLPALSMAAHALLLIGPLLPKLVGPRVYKILSDPLLHPISELAKRLVVIDSLQSWLLAGLIWFVMALVLAALALTLMRAAVLRGLEFGFGADNTLASSAAFSHPVQAVAANSWTARCLRRWRDPLVQKELLWLRRDRGALLQIFAIPLVSAVLVLIQLQGVINDHLLWHQLAAFVFGMGGYILLVSGPRSLLSEIPALLLILSWPRELAETLRIKVYVLLGVVTIMVWATFLGLTLYSPESTFGLLMCALIWPLFGIAMAEKSVTLVGHPSSTGVPEPVPFGHRLLVSLGTFTAAIGLYRAQYGLVFVGLLLNWMLAEAVWQQFSIRLRYFFDPSNEPSAAPPTLTSALVALMAMLEVSLILMIAFTAFLGAAGTAFAYASASIAACIALLIYNIRRGVDWFDIFYFAPEERASWPVHLGYLSLAISAGLALGMLALAYVQLLPALGIPAFETALREAEQFKIAQPELQLALSIIAVGMAPFFEEFLFRGHLFRALLRDRGLSYACLLSAGFFACMHPVIAWPPVFLLGLASALLFYRTRSLWHCIVLHAVYNAVVCFLAPS